MATHHDEDTMPEETQGYKLSQPKQSIAEYQQMGTSIYRFQTSNPQRGHGQWAAYRPLCKQVCLRCWHRKPHGNKQVLCGLQLGVSLGNLPGSCEPCLVNLQCEAPPPEDKTAFNLAPHSALLGDLSGSGIGTALGIPWAPSREPKRH